LAFLPPLHDAYDSIGGKYIVYLIVVGMPYPTTPMTTSRII